MAVSIDLRFLRDRRARNRIAVTTAICVSIGVVYAILAPKWYRSTLTVVSAKSSRTAGISSVLGGELGSLAAGLGGMAGEGADVQRIAAVLQSVSVSDAVIQKFDLKTRYGEVYSENTRDALWKHCDVKVLTKPGLVQLSCEDKDPQFVQELLNYFAEHGNEVFRRVSVTSATEQVRFLEQHVNELRNQADETSTRMREFQEKYRIVDIETQTKAVVGAIAALNNQRITKQLELDYIRTFSSADESSAQQLESQLALVDRKLADMAEAGQSSAAPADRVDRAPRAGLFPAALTVPKLRAEYEKLYRDRKVAEATLIFSLERLESARADEARNTSTFLILDPPALPTRKSRPSRALIVFAALTLGLAAGVGIEAWRAGVFGRPGRNASSATADR